VIKQAWVNVLYLIFVPIAGEWNCLEPALALIEAYLAAAGR
jgi:hypothetical protein